MKALALVCMIGGAFWALSGRSEAAVGLHVRVKGVKVDHGPVIVAIYRDAATWLKAGKALEVKNLASTTTEVGADFSLPPDTYAVSIFQDENQNGKLDMQWLPPGPAEPWVVSNNAQGSFGPPTFKDAQLPLSSEKTVVLMLQKP